MQLLWLLLLNIILSKIVLGKNRPKYHQNVWYLRIKNEQLNNQLPVLNNQPVCNKTEIISKVSKKWKREVFNKKSNKIINPNCLDIGFFIPAPIKGGGGHRNIFRAIKFLKDVGHKVTIYYTMTNEEAVTVKNNVSEWFYDMTDIPFVHFEGETGFHDIGICTFWTTAYDMTQNIHKIKFPFYFVQDFEPMFYQMGSEYILAENTYKMGFYHICSGPWCKDFLINKYKAKAESFQFPIDTYIYNRKISKIKKNKNIIFFAKPEMPRRCYDVGIKALECFNKLCPNVEIIMFGSNQVDSSKLSFPITNLGLLPTINDLANLYRNADFGLVFSTTNPSLVPYEMMSCGCPVGDFDLDLVLSKYGNSSDNVFLLNPIPEKMGEELAKIFKNPKEMKRRGLCGYKFVQKEFPTELEMGKTVERIIKENITFKK